MFWFSGHDFWTWIYQTESEETEPSYSCMDVTTVQETFSLSDNSSRFRNPIKEVLSDLQYQGQLRLTLRRVQYGQIVFLTVKWLAAVENIPNFDYLYVDDISRWFIVKVKKRYENFYPPPPSLKSLSLLANGILRLYLKNYILIVLSRSCFYDCN